MYKGGNPKVLANLGTLVRLLDLSLVFPPAPKKGMVKFSKKGTFSARQPIKKGTFRARRHVNMGPFKRMSVMEAPAYILIISTGI